MSSLDFNLLGQNTAQLSKSVKLCTFCNNSTNGFDKWLHVTEQDKSPFFPILAEIRGEDTVFDDQGRALVCIACFHHLLRQWSSYERRCIPLKKRQYNLITEEKLSNFQIKREEEIRKEGELRLREIKLREQKIKQEAQGRLDLFREKERKIREEAEKRLVEEGEELEAIKREAERQLREEQAHEEELKRLLEEEIRLERQKGDYIRKEAERLLREEKLINSTYPAHNVRTEVLIHSPQGRAFDQITSDHHFNERTDKGANEDNLQDTMEPRRSRTMEYDPVTGCYVRKVPLDFKDKKVEDIVREEMIKSERKANIQSTDSAWKNTEDKERGSTPDAALVDLSLRSSGQNGDKSLPYYVSGEGMETEYKFTVKEEIKTESKPSGLSKNGELADENIQKAGEGMKSKFDSDRSKFERDSEEVVMRETTKRSFERRRRSDEDLDFKKAREDTKKRTLSLDRRLKDMEERRARLFNEDKTEASEVTITGTVTTETSHSSPATEDTMLGEKMQEAHRRHRNREERIRRRKGAEELISKKSPEGEDKPKSPSVKSAGVKLELRGSAIKKTEDSKSESEPHAFSGSSYSYYSQDDASDITFTVKNSATETKKEGDDKKEGTFDWNEKEQQSSSRTTETRNTSGSLMDEPIVWSQTGSDYPGSGGAESKRSIIKETEVKVVESKSVQSLFSSDFGRDEPQDIVFALKETSTSNKRTTLEDDKKDSDSSKSKPKELTLERGSYDDKYSFKSTSNSDLLKWEMDNVDSGKKASEPEAAQDTTDGYMDSLRRTNALGRVGSFKKGRDELPPAIFHDIESDAPGAPIIDIRTDTPPVSRESTMDSGGQAPNLIKQLQDEDIDNERQRKRLEIEEKKRRIAESQKKANVQRRRDVSHSKKEGDGGSGSTDNIEDLSEKRRSLLMMWESYAEGEGPGPENRDLQEKPKGFGYEDMMREAAQSDPNTEIVDYRTMDVDDEKEETRTPLVDIDEYHKLNDDELKWERAGQFQPGKLKTKFHEMGKDEQSYEPKNMRKVMNNNNTTDVTTKVFRGEQRFDYKVPVEEDQSYADETTEVESAPKQLWDDAEGQTTSKSDDEDDYDSRKPHVDVDEVHRMTEAEARWEKVGHFQPGKINTSVFETRKKADKSEPAGSSGIQRGEKSRYEQIKKIQRTDSKKELLVPKKVVLKTDRHEDFQEEDEPERPHIGKIEAPLFHGTESEDERQRREREARNRREMEEIQREREEERRRQERENLESKTSLNEFEDDEFDAKVKSKDVRKIDITKFGDFQKSSGATDVKPASRQSTKRIAESHREEKVTKTTYRREDDDYDIQVRHRSVGKLSMDSSPFIQRDTSVKETCQPHKVQERTLSKSENIVIEESPMEMASPGEEEFDNMTRARSVKKLDVSRFPFSCDDNYDKAPRQDNRQVADNKVLKYDKKDKSQDKMPLVEERRKEREREKREWEEQLKRERDEIEQIKKAHDKTFQDNFRGGDEIDTNDYETETRNIRKLDLSMFSKFQQGDAACEKPVRKTSNKDSKRGYVQKDEIVVAQTTREVESAPDFSYEEDEYEIKRRSVGKLNKDWLSQAQEQEARDAELRRKEAEMDRIKKEQYEIEQQRMEEKRRRENERDEFEVSRDESDLTSDKLQTVKKLDSSTMSPFLKGGNPAPVSGGGPSRKKNKDEVRQERKLARKESRTKMQTQETLYVQKTGEVQQSPESFDDRPQEVGRLNTGKYLQMMGEDISDKERRKKLLEEERMRRELKEMERQREDDERRKEMDRDDTSSSSSSEKPQNVNKLDLAQFSQFQQQDRTVVPKKQPAKQIPRETKKETRTEIIEKQPVDEVESEPFVPETSEREWLEKERSEALMYEEKRKSVGRLDVNRLIQTRTEEEQERQSRIKELERQRLITEREEMERLKAEKKGKKTTDVYSEVSSERSQEDKKAPLVKSSDSQRDREREEEWTVEEKRKSGVGRLNVDQFMQSLSKEEEEKNRRKLELEKERVRREAEERERLQMEQQVSSENIKVSSVQEVQSAPDDDHLYERGRREEREREEELTVEEKRKSVGRLDVNRFVQSINEEADEKRRRKIELEKERIRRENEEKELLRLEQEREHREPHFTSSQETSKKYVIVHRDTETSGEQGGEKKEKERYSSLERERKDEMTVEEKRKSVGRLDFNQYLQSLSQEDEEKRRRTIELERERRRREEEEKELLRLEQERGRSDDVSRSTSSATSKSSYEKISRTVVQDVESSPYDQPDDGPQQPSRIDQEREEEMSVEEKRKSIGRLNVNQFFQSLNEEEEEKQRRRIELERERIRRENEERELLRMEQERLRNDRSVEQARTSVVEDVHSAPPDDIIFTEKDKRSSLERDREEAMSVEEKRKSVGRLDVNKFMQSISEEDREKQLRKIELERERLRREKEERELEEKQLRLRESSSYSEQIQTQSSSVQVVHSAAPIEYEDGPDESSQDQKEVGRLDLEKFSQQFNEEARERKRRIRELEIERLRLEREEMEGRGGSQTVEHESWSSERRETTIVEEKQNYRGDDVDRRPEGHTDSIKSDESSDSDKLVPKRLDLSKFSAFQSGSGKRQTKDDTAVKRREKSGAESKARPKSIAGSSIGVTNGDARSGNRVYRIIH